MPDADRPKNQVDIANPLNVTPTDVRSALSQTTLDLSVEKIVQILREQGVRPHPTPTAIWQRIHQQLDEAFHIARDIRKLRTNGIREETLLAAVLLMRFAPGIDHFLKEAFGNKKERNRNRRLLHAPIPVLSQLA